jgi:hypothetical protein
MQNTPKINVVTIFFDPDNVFVSSSVNVSSIEEAEVKIKKIGYDRFFKQEFEEESETPEEAWDVYLDQVIDESYVFKSFEYKDYFECDLVNKTLFIDNKEIPKSVFDKFE